MLTCIVDRHRLLQVETVKCSVMYDDVALNMTIVHLNPCCPALLYVNGVHSFLAVFIFVQSLSSAPALMQLTKLAASLSAILMFFFPRQICTSPLRELFWSGTRAKKKCWLYFAGTAWPCARSAASETFTLLNFGSDGEFFSGRKRARQINAH